MTISDEMLMAYVDGELDREARIAVEQAMTADAAVAARIEQHRTLRARLRAAYDPVLDEAVPERLIHAARTLPTQPASANVTALHSSRSRAVPRWSGREWTAIAASLIVGALVSALALRSFAPAPIESRGGLLVARGALASALTTQLASRPSSRAAVAIGITFLSKSGNYCRTFTLEAIAGLACRDQGAWQIEALARTEPAITAGSSYRTAASSIPQAVLDAASAEMAGEPLDSRAEAAARAGRWMHR